MSADNNSGSCVVDSGRTGFASEDYSYLADRLKQAMLDCDRRTLEALLSNNVNVILAALDEVSGCSKDSIIRGLQARVDHWEGIHRKALRVIAEQHADCLEEDGSGGLVGAVAHVCRKANP